MATGLAQYWSDCLPNSHREALHSALCWLADDFIGVDDCEDSLLADLLPRTWACRVVRRSTEARGASTIGAPRGS